MLFTTYYLLLTTYYLLLTSSCLLLAACCSLLTTYHLPFTIYYWLLATHYSLLTTSYYLLLLNRANLSGGFVGEAKLLSDAVALPPFLSPGAGWANVLQVEGYNQIRSDQIRSDQIRSDQIRSDQIRSDESVMIAIRAMIAIEWYYSFFPNAH